jgi:hypothetical protein
MFFVENGNCNLADQKSNLSILWWVDFINLKNIYTLKEAYYSYQGRKSSS